MHYSDIISSTNSIPGCKRFLLVLLLINYFCNRFILNCKINFNFNSLTLFYDFLIIHDSLTKMKNKKLNNDIFDKNFGKHIQNL